MKNNFKVTPLYCLVSKKEIGENGQSYIGYGIACSEGEGKILFDISPCKTEVQTMIRKFNKLHLSPIHLIDAVEDCMC